jgi:hypothetical protein
MQGASNASVASAATVGLTEECLLADLPDDVLNIILSLTRQRAGTASSCRRFRTLALRQVEVRCLPCRHVAISAREGILTTAMLLPQLTELLVIELPPAVSRAVLAPLSRLSCLTKLSIYSNPSWSSREFHEQAWDVDAQVEAASASSDTLIVHSAAALSAAPRLSPPAGTTDIHATSLLPALALTLRHLELAGLGLRPDATLVLAQLTALKYLDVGNNHLLAGPVDALTALTALSHLELSRNDSTGACLA